MAGYRHHQQTRALLDYVIDHGSDDDVLVSPGRPDLTYVSLEAVDRYFRDRETERGRKAAATHRLRERIRAFASG